MLQLRKLYLQRKKEGKVNAMTELGEMLWPDSTRESMVQNVQKLFAGKTKRIEFEWIPIICKWLDVTPNELFENYQEEK